jgi:hypothetical protein
MCIPFCLLCLHAGTSPVLAHATVQLLTVGLHCWRRLVADLGVAFFEDGVGVTGPASASGVCSRSVYLLLLLWACAWGPCLVTLVSAMHGSGGNKSLCVLWGEGGLGRGNRISPALLLFLILPCPRVRRPPGAAGASGSDPSSPVSAAEFRDMANAYAERLCERSGPEGPLPVNSSVVTHLKSVVELTSVSLDVREGAAWCLLTLANVRVGVGSGAGGSGAGGVHYSCVCGVGEPQH